MLNEDYKDMLLALSAEKVKYLLIGAYALAAHGYPRATMDIDIITTASGLRFEDAFSRSHSVNIEGIQVHIPSKDDLIRNKRASGRTKDLADAEALESLKNSEPNG
jgi:hypothetical protein